MQRRDTAWCIALLAGGESEERAISVQSGEAVQRALMARGHTVVWVDPAEVTLEQLDWRVFDVAFLALHGRYGEDGGVQRILEHAGIAYTGSGPQATYTAFHKALAKEHFIRAGVPTPLGAVVRRGEDWSKLQQRAVHVGFPLIVKPEAQGSSLGVSWVDSLEALFPALQRVWEYDDTALMEPALTGEEWTVGVFGERCFPPLKIVPTRKVFDYQAKYHDEATRIESPACAPRELVTQLQRLAWRACDCLGVSGLARVDLRLDRLGQPWVLEVNTIPGMTDHSLLPKAAALAGWTLGELCELAIREALRPPVPRPHLFQAYKVRQPPAWS
ncbi:MAG: D-alanine--D-alanine ligase B [Planctomycetaceae bacterium]|nr:MAG: D-alanine--D-alanine ligase B [Planctomycetaceae bacterium]